MNVQDHLPANRPFAVFWKELGVFVEAIDERCRRARALASLIEAKNQYEMDVFMTKYQCGPHAAARWIRRLKKGRRERSKS